MVGPGVFFDPYNVPKLTLLLASTGIAAGLFLIERAYLPPPRADMSLAGPAALLTVPVLVAWLGSPFGDWAVMGAYNRFQGLIPAIALALFGILLAEAVSDHPESLAWAFVASGSAVGAIATYQMLFLGQDVDTFSTTSFVTSTLGHSNFAGAYLAITLPSAITLWLRDARGKRVAMAATILIVDGILFTFSQGAWLAAIGGVGLAIGSGIWRGRPLLRRMSIGLAPLTAAVSVGLVLLASVSLDLAQRFPSIFRSVRLRGFLWQGAVEMWAERPFIGWGPNAFAWHGLLHRTQEEALIGGSRSFGDDPHSVPLAIAAHTGLLGMVAALAAFVWVIHRWRSAGARNALGPAFAGGAAAYLIQALGSLDELSLRVGLWVCLAGLWGATKRPQASSEPAPVQQSARRRAALTALGVSAVLIGGWLAFSTGLADVLARRGGVALARDRVADGRAIIDRAQVLRADPRYLTLKAELLGDAALEAEEEGRPLIDEMSSIFRMLDRQGDPTAAGREASLLHAWSLFDPDADVQALARVRRARDLDPSNPALAVTEADVLVALGRPDEAIEALTPIAETIDKRFPDYRYSSNNEAVWGALAIAHAEAGERTDALAALEIAVGAPAPDCRARIAEALLETHRSERPMGLEFICPQVLLRLLPESPADRS